MWKWTWRFRLRVILAWIWKRKPLFVLTALVFIVSAGLSLSIFKPILIVGNERRNVIALPHPKFLNVSNFAFLRNNEETCTLSPSEANESLLVVLIISARDHFEYRKSIRETWSSVRSHGGWNIRRIFILGNHDRDHHDPDDDPNWANWSSDTETRLKGEIIKYGDIAVSDFEDTYLNLTTKHVVSYKWVLDYCPQARYVLKCDDDMFVNVFQLVNFLNAKAEAETETVKLASSISSNNLVCHEWKSEPERSPGDLWYVSYEDYAGDTFPLYCIDAAYLITPAIIRRLYSVHDQVKYIWISDCFVTGLLRVHYNERIESNQSVNLRSKGLTPLASVGIEDIQHLYQFNNRKLLWNPRTLFYLLKKRQGEGMSFQAMEAYWSLALVQYAQEEEEAGTSN